MRGKTMKLNQMRSPYFANGHYSEGFKQYLVLQIQQGKLNMEQARLQYGIGGKCTVSKWCKKYSNSFNGVQVKQIQEDSETLARENAKLRKELEQSKLRNEYYEIILELAKEDLGYDVKKNFAAELARKYILTTKS